MLSQQPLMRSEQRLKMTPRMIQATAIMALPLQELNSKIEEELDRNPALEIKEDVDNKADIELLSKSENLLKETVEDNHPISLDTAHDRNSQSQLISTSKNSSDSNNFNQRSLADRNQQFIEGVLSNTKTLQEHLLWQLRLQPISKIDFSIGESLIQNLDSNGFLIESPKSFLSIAELNKIDKISSLIQQLDPIGCCSLSVKDSLLIQIQLHPNPVKGSFKLIKDHWSLLEKGNIKEITKAMGVAKIKIQNILKFIKTLEPFPGRNFETQGKKIKYIIPDVFVKLINNQLTLFINDEQIPTLGVTEYFETLKAKTKDNSVKKFVDSSLQDAHWFIRSIQERNNSLLKVSQAIIEFQRKFFLHGPKFLTPLTLKDIAAEIGFHESTISRLTRGKYIQTDLGIFELSYFFSNHVSGKASTISKFSKTAVKEIILEIILSDKKNEKPLSDNHLTKLLQDKGVPIKRRTVTNYRRELNIESSYDRTKF